MRRELAAAHQAAARLSREQDEQCKSLGRLREELHKAGIDTRDFGSAQWKVREQIERTEGSIRRMSRAAQVGRAAWACGKIAVRGFGIVSAAAGAAGGSGGFGAAVNHWALDEIERMPWSRLLAYRALAVKRAKLLFGGGAAAG